jgi:branched-subunit amino acid ABC-type transport system permease component
MVLLGLAIERTVLRPLVNKPPITLFMATLGLSYVIEGVAHWCGELRCMVWTSVSMISLLRLPGF